MRNLITAIILIIAYAGYAQTPQGPLVDKIIAKVDNYIVLKSDLERNYLDQLAQGLNPGDDTKCRVLEGLVINKLLVAKAEIDSVIVLDDEVELSLDRKMDYFIAQIGSEQKLEEYYGKSIEDFKEEIRELEKEQLIIQRMQGEITADISVTPGEVRKFFNSIPKDSLPYFSKEVTVGQITKKPEVSKEQKDAIKQRLIELRDRILNGEDFNELARTYSEEPIARRTGGELNWYRRGELAPEFEAAALKLKPGELSMPVETDFGIHLIQLNERRGNEFNSRHILIRPQPSLTDYENTIDYLDSLRILIESDSLEFEKVAKEHSDDRLTSASGGFFLDASGAMRISVDELDPIVFFTIDTMEVGTISRPVKYSTQTGDEEIRILYYKAANRPHQANLKDDWLKIQQAALNQKRSEILGEWFKDAKNEVFITIDDEYNQCKILN